MRKKLGEKQGRAGGARRHFQITLFGGIVLVGVLAMIVRTKSSGEAALFNGNSEITLYAKTTAGAAPALNAAKFFPDEKLNPAKFSYDLSACDFDTPGLYRIPVFYGERETDCVIQLEVLASAQQKPASADENASLENVTEEE